MAAVNENLFLFQQGILQKDSLYCYSAHWMERWNCKQQTIRWLYTVAKAPRNE